MSPENESLSVTADCGHTTTQSTKMACSHLLANADADHSQYFTGYGQYFTGVGKEYALICGVCSKEPETRTAHLRNVCETCFEQIEEEGLWEWIAGSPVVTVTPSDLHFVHQQFHLPTLSGDDLLDIQPFHRADGRVWVALTKQGTLVQIQFGSEPTVTLLCAVPVGLDGEPLKILHLAPDGTMAVLFARGGTDGAVIETATGTQTMRLKRDGYHSDVSPFPVAFFEHEHQLLLIHGTEWNRLDVSNPRTGELLTDRAHPPYKKDDPPPEHCLDYFHGRLLVSPDHQWIVDDGWVWAPAGIPTCWNLRRWVDTNPWESEDGESKYWLGQRWYFWSGPICWVNTHVVAIWGYGDDDEWLLPAAVLYDVTTGRMTDWFPGTEVDLLTHATEWRRWLILNREGFFFDQYLFSVSETRGIQVWKVETGARLLEDASFSPIRYHRGTKEFLTLLPDGRFQLSTLAGQEDAS